MVPLPSDLTSLKVTLSGGSARTLARVVLRGEGGFSPAGQLILHNGEREESIAFDFGQADHCGMLVNLEHSGVTADADALELRLTRMAVGATEGEGHNARMDIFLEEEQE